MQIKLTLWGAHYIQCQIVWDYGEYPEDCVKFRFPRRQARSRYYMKVMRVRGTKSRSVGNAMLGLGGRHPCTHLGPLCALFAPSMRPLCALYVPHMRPLCARYIGASSPF